MPEPPTLPPFMATPLNWTRTSSQTGRNRGFSLIEVLVAVIVLAAGLLGIAGLQVSVLRANDSARLRSVAIFAAYDAADRIRADPAALLDTSQTVSIEKCPDESSATEGFKRWAKDFCAYNLPEPLNSEDAMTIDCSATGACGDGNCAITVRWDDSHGEPKSGQRNASFTFCTRLPIL